MPVYKIREAGRLGIVQDDEPHDLPSQNGGPLAWSLGENIRFKDGYVERHKGWTDFFTPSVTPYGVFPYPEVSGDYYWIYPGLDKVYAYDGTTHSNITRQTAAVDVDYTGDEDDKWNGGVLGNVLVLNNGVDVPQYWPLPVGTSQKLDDLSNWDANWTAKIIRPHRSFIVAGNVAKSGTRYPTLVKWSSAADPGTVPGSWDETDPGEEAGETPVGSSSGFILDLLELRDSLMIYKEDAVWAMDFIGGSPVWAFRQALKTRGLMAQGLVQEFYGRHLMVAKGDIVAHDGQTDEPVLRKRWRDTFFNLIDQEYASRSFMVPFHRRDEMWICFPEHGETLPNKALVWNWRDGTVGLRDIPSSTAGATGIVGLGGGARLWSDDVNLTWAEADFSWGERSLNPLDRSIVLANASSVLVADKTNQEAGTNFESLVERTGLNLTDDLTVSTVTGIWPRMEGSADIYVGSQFHPNDAVTWQGPFAFNSNTDKKIDCFVTGVWHAIRIKSASNAFWRFSGANLDFQPAGLR